MGTHQELVARADGIYRRLYELQYRDSTAPTPRAASAAATVRPMPA
jgi:ATP-binding cassette subfamily B protein